VCPPLSSARSHTTTFGTACTFEIKLIEKNAEITKSEIDFLIPFNTKIG
jgi:hypothetical protein